MSKVCHIHLLLVCSARKWAKKISYCRFKLKDLTKRFIFSFPLQIRWAQSNDRNLPRSGGRKEPNISVRNDKTIKFFFFFFNFEQIGFSFFFFKLVMHVARICCNQLEACTSSILNVVLTFLCHSALTWMTVIVVSYCFSLRGFQNSKLSCKVRGFTKTLSVRIRHAIWK